MIAEGIYRARALRGEIGKTHTTNNDQAVIEFELLEGPEAGQTLRYFGVVTKKTEKFVIPGLIACGWTGQIGSDQRTLVGIERNQVDIEVVHEMYDGRTVVKVRGILDPNATLAGRPMTPAEASSFVNRFGGFAAQGAAEKKNAGAQRRPQPTKAAALDDFPMG